MHDFETLPHRAGSTRRVVLMTGASGVVGRALLNRLRHLDVVCLVHRSAPAGARSTVAGDITQPNLGMSESSYRNLAARVDAVIHCAAITDFSAADGVLQAVNVDGVCRVARFADLAGVPLYHLSTAFVGTRADEQGQVAARYADSKRRAEAALRAGSVRHVILRPSVVTGDSVTGEIGSFQGLHRVARTMLAGAMPIIPFDPQWRLDFVPSDFVADAVATVLDHGIDSGEYWITAGSEALSLGEAVRQGIRHAAELGVPVDPPRFVPPDLYERLIKPAFESALPTAVRANVERLLEFFSVYLSSAAALPSSRPQLARLGVSYPGAPVDVLRTTVRRVVEAQTAMPARGVA